jgi:hypothetical protein
VTDFRTVVSFIFTVKCRISELKCEFQLQGKVDDFRTFVSFIFMVKCRISELLLASSSGKSIGFQDCCEFHRHGKV